MNSPNIRAADETKARAAPLPKNPQNRSEDSSLTGLLKDKPRLMGNELYRGAGGFNLDRHFEILQRPHGFLLKLPKQLKHKPYGLTKRSYSSLM